MENRDSFIFYRSFFESIKYLPNKERLKVFDAICDYSLNFKDTELTGTAEGMFNLMRPNLEANNKRYVNGSKPKQKQTASKPTSKPQANKDKDKDKDKDKEGEISTVVELSTTLLSGLKVSEYLLSKILTNKPNFRKPNLETWSKDIDLAIRIDRRTESELINCINWIYTDQGSFWIPNILSAKKLREKFDTMEAQIMKSGNKNKKLQDNLRLMEEIQNAG